MRVEHKLGRKGYLGMAVPDTTLILHISDLHFGSDHDVGERASRQLALDGLVAQLSQLDSRWKPEVICITGDIGYRGHKEDYCAAREWFAKLTAGLGLTPEALFLCPGNHDVDRSIAKGNARPKDAQEADEVLTYPIYPHWEQPFAEFSDFCKGSGIAPYQIGSSESYLVGCRKYQDINFVSLNSAWCSKDDNDEGKLWLGLPQINHMAASGQLPSPDNLLSEPITIVLVHHPKEWLNESERYSFGPRPGTIVYLAKRSHLILAGHAHGRVAPADLLAETAWYLGGGATYVTHDYFNSFRLIRVEPGRFLYRSFEYEPSSPEHLWKTTGEAQELPIPPKAPLKLVSSIPKGIPLQNYREKALEDAKRFIESKSRAIKPTGRLPEIIPLDVAVHEKHWHHQAIESRRDRRRHRQERRLTLPPYEAVRQSRRVLLLGDLGSGKSTILGCLVHQILAENERALAFVIPAKKLRVSSLLSVGDFLNAASEYFSNHIAPTEQPLNLKDVLDGRVEVTFVLDGLDEQALPSASKLVHLFGDLANHWPNVQTVASGRPVELSGLSYEDWQVVTTIELNEDDQIRLFEAEAVAEGKSPVEAKETAAQLSERVRELPTADTLAATPLGVRLLYARLVSSTSDSDITLGDLLCESLRDHLGRWASKDLKEQIAPVFEGLFPLEESRAELLGELLLEFRDHRSVGAEKIKSSLRRILERRGQRDELLVDQAIHFYRTAGLLILNDEVQLPPQPFFEVLCGYGLAYCWEQSLPLSLRLEDWRRVSFAATVVRRRGLLDSLRDQLTTFLGTLLSKPGHVSAAAYVVSESKDSVIAGQFVNSLRSVGRRPLRVIQEEWYGSTKAIADSLCLAGDDGFDWFFENYLDPRYPIVFAGSAIIDRIFVYWAKTVVGRLSKQQKKRLKSLIWPHLTAQTHQLIDIIPTVVALLPEEFSPEDRIWFAGTLLGKGFFSEIGEGILRTEFESGNKELVNAALVQHAERDYENSARAAALWMMLNASRPPINVLKAVIRACGSYHRNPRLDSYVSRCVELIGQNQWHASLRWALFSDDSHLSAGAAIKLQEQGEKRLLLIGKPLLRALHDGGYVGSAEIVLSSLIGDSRPQSVSWLGQRIAQAKEEFDGAHSGWWRIFLKELPETGEKGPELLASGIGSVGHFLFPRYPEIRQGFRDLLSGPLGINYRSVLGEKLYTTDPKVRRAAAMALIVADPENADDALDTLLRARAGERHAPWHEWDEFCLATKFGPAVISRLRSKLSTFESDSQTVALAILYNNEQKLTDDEYRQLVRGFFENLFLTEELTRVLQDSRSFPVLVSLVEEDLSDKAASILLSRYPNEISEQLHALCAVLTTGGRVWDPVPFDEIIRRIEQEPSYAQAIEKASETIVGRTGKSPLLDLFRRTCYQQDQSAWEELVWTLVADDSHWSGIGGEDRGHWLLDFGRTQTQFAEYIGKSAKKLLQDPRIIASPRAEGRRWLALLADEFAPLAKKEIESVLTHGFVIERATTCALLARLGHTPEGFHVEVSVANRARLEVTSPEPGKTREELLELLKDYARPSEVLHPQCCQIIELALFEPRLTLEDINEIGSKGTNGSLIAGALTYVFGDPPNADYSLSLLGFRRTWYQQQDRCLRLLLRIWKSFHYTLVTEDPQTRRTYLGHLEEKLSQLDDPAAVAAELLAINGNLPNRSVRSVFEYQAKHCTHYDYGLTEELIRWMACDHDSEMQALLGESLELGLSILDAQPWEPDSHTSDSAPLCFLAYAVGYWRLLGRVDDVSARAFFRGLKFTFSKGLSPNLELKAEFILSAVEPLLSRIPRSLIDEALAKGEAFDDPAVRAICHLFRRERA